MLRVGVEEAQARFAHYVDLASHGEVVLICRGDAAIAELRGLRARPKGKRPIGLHKGLFEVGPEFFEPMSDEELKLWYGGDV